MGFTRTTNSKRIAPWDAGFRSPGQLKHSIEAAHQLCCTCTGWCHLLRVERYPQYSAASVGPGLYILFLFTCSKEVVLGSAVTPIKSARLRSHQDASPLPCLASPRAASPGRPLSLSLSETEGSAVCIVHIVYITAFDYRAWQDIINRATPTRRHNLHSYTISLLLTAIVIFFFKKSLFYFHPIIFFRFLTVPSLWH